MNLFQNVKYGVSCREAAERYGVSVNRQSKALCPFHNDRHPSLCGYVPLFAGEAAFYHR